MFQRIERVEQLELVTGGAALIEWAMDWLRYVMHCGALVRGLHEFIWASGETRSKE